METQRKIVKVKFTLPNGENGEMDMELNLEKEVIDGRVFFSTESIKESVGLILGQKFSSILFYPEIYEKHPFQLESLQLQFQTGNDLSFTMVDSESPVVANVVFIENLGGDNNTNSFKISTMLDGRSRFPSGGGALTRINLRGITREISIRTILESDVFQKYFFSEMKPLLKSGVRYKLSVVEISLIYSECILNITTS